MGLTLSHEHVFIDGSTWRVEPDSPDRERSQADPRMEDLWWFRQWPNTSGPNLVLDDTATAVTELNAFRSLGGQTVVDLTPGPELGRDPIRLREAAAATGMNIICGTGFYVQAAHPAVVAAASAEELAGHMTTEILSGIGDSGIRAGVIGELGVSHPITAAERKVLEAGALSQRQTGAAISIHTACDFPEAHSAVAVAEILEAAGADLSRVIMGHMDTAVGDPGYLLAVAEKGCVIEFDLFGNETFHSEYGFDIPGDSEKIRAVIMLIREGLAAQIVLSHDTAMKIQLTRYGGYGYGHLLRNIAPRLELAGVGPAEVDGLLRANPQRLFPLQPGISDPS